MYEITDDEWNDFFTGGTPKSNWHTSNKSNNWYFLSKIGVMAGYWRRIVSEKQLKWCMENNVEIRQINAKEFNIYNHPYTISLFEVKQK